MQDFFDNAEVIEIDLGDGVLCDLCGHDWTHRTESGGVYGLGSKAICPDCTPSVIASCERYNETHFIKARCPENKSFADWVRDDLR